LHLDRNHPRRDRLRNRNQSHRQPPSNPLHPHGV